MTSPVTGLTEVNWALSKSGASVVSSSYEATRVSGEASNLLTAREDQLWITGDPPQSVILELHPTHPELRYAGWHVWRDYLTNPKTVEIASGETVEKLSPLLVCEALPGGGTQVWRLPWPIPASHRYVRFTILSTFGAGPTYMNNLVLLASDPGPGLPAARDSPAQGTIHQTTTTPAHVMTQTNTAYATSSTTATAVGTTFGATTAHSYTPPAARRDAATAPLVTTTTSTNTAPSPAAGHEMRATLSTLPRQEATSTMPSSALGPVPLSLSQQDRLLSLPSALNNNSAATPRNQPTTLSGPNGPQTNTVLSHTAGCTTHIPEGTPQTNMESGTTGGSSRMNRLLKDLDNDIRLLKPIKSVSPHRNMLAYVPHELPPAADIVLDEGSGDEDEEEQLLRRKKKEARQKRRKSSAIAAAEVTTPTPSSQVRVPLAELQAATAGVASHELHSVQDSVRHTTERLALLEQAVAALTQTMQHQREDLTMIKRVLLQQATERRRAAYHDATQPTTTTTSAATRMRPAQESPQALVVSGVGNASNTVAAVTACGKEGREAAVMSQSELDKERFALHTLRSSLEHRLTHHQIDVDFPEAALRSYVESVLEQRLARQLRRAEAKTLNKLESQLQSIVADLSLTVEQRVRSQLERDRSKHGHHHHHHRPHRDTQSIESDNEGSVAESTEVQRRKERGSRRHKDSVSRHGTSSPHRQERSSHRREHGATQSRHKHAA